MHIKLLPVTNIASFLSTAIYVTVSKWLLIYRAY